MDKNRLSSSKFDNFLPDDSSLFQIVPLPKSNEPETSKKYSYTDISSLILKRSVTSTSSQKSSTHRHNLTKEFQSINKINLRDKRLIVCTNNQNLMTQHINFQLNMKYKFSIIDAINNNEGNSDLLSPHSFNNKQNKPFGAEPITRAYPCLY